MLEKLPGTQPVTVGGDKGFDTQGFVAECRNINVTPHVAQNHQRRGGSAIDGRTTRHPGYAISQRKRKRIEECFGWLKTIALMRKLQHRGVCRVDWISLSPARPTIWCACETSRPQVLRCKSRPNCVPQRKKIALGARKALRINLSDIEMMKTTKDEKENYVRR
jgi:hypothetical protein